MGDWRLKLMCIVSKTAHPHFFLMLELLMRKRRRFGTFVQFPHWK
jgi:hypothetical protein